MGGEGKVKEMWGLGGEDAQDAVVNRQLMSRQRRSHAFISLVTSMPVEEDPREYSCGRFFGVGFLRVHALMLISRAVSAAATTTAWVTCG